MAGDFKVDVAEESAAWTVDTDVSRSGQAINFTRAGEQLAGKEEMLARIRAALGSGDAGDQSPAGVSQKPVRDVGGWSEREGADQDATAPQPATTSRTDLGASQAELVSQFCLELEGVSGHAVIVHSSDEIKSYLEKLLRTTASGTVAVSDARSLREASLRDWLGERGVSVVPTLGEFSESKRRPGGSIDGNLVMEQYKAALIEAGLGITGADYGIAETGTLVLLSGGEQHRLISLLPPVHVCLLDSSRILPNLREVITRVRTELYSNERPPQAMTLITGTSRTADIELTLTRGVHGPRELHVLLY